MLDCPVLDSNSIFRPAKFGYFLPSVNKTLTSTVSVWNPSCWNLNLSAIRTFVSSDFRHPYESENGTLVSEIWTVWKLNSYWVLKSRLDIRHALYIIISFLLLHCSIQETSSIGLRNKIYWNLLTTNYLSIISPLWCINRLSSSWKTFFFKKVINNLRKLSRGGW